MISYESNLETSDELAAVNDMLASIGESPVNTLEGDTNADIANARRLLDKVNTEVQAKGWTFNIEESVELVPDVFSKFIAYMPDYLTIRTPGGASAYTNRGGYLYDRLNLTDQFTSSVVVDLIRLRPYSEMPTQFRSYIVAKAARRFNIRFFGAAEIEGSLQMEENEAWAAVQEYELEFGNFNMLGGDAWTSGRTNR
jgi:hypothetical protein